MSNPLHKRVLFTLFALTLISPSKFSQTPTRNEPQPARPVCDQQQALLLIAQQVDEAKSFEKPVPTISILIRAADLLWPYQQEKARAIFTESYELASQNFQQRGDELRSEGRMRVQLPDQRFVVMAAIARRDPAWARRLAERAAEETKRDAEQAVAEAKNDAAKAVASAGSPDNRREMGGKIVGLAMSMLVADQQAAISLVSRTLGYPTPVDLPRFLFKLAESDHSAADQLCQEAISAYANARIDGLFYLSVYPFALNRMAGPGTITTYYTPPQNFLPNSNLQQFFLAALINRGEMSLKAETQIPPDIRGLPPTQYPESAQIYMALVSLEPHIAQRQPALLERAAVLRSTLGASLPSALRQRAEEAVRGEQALDKDEFGTELERAQRESDPGRRDMWLALAVLGAPATESTDRLYDLVRKISEERVREQLLNWLYFSRAQKAIKDGLLDDARQLAGKVEALDQRGYLSYEIAAEALKRLDDKARAREALDDVAAIAAKAPNTNEKARTLLGVAHLYASFDHLRAFEVIADAIKTINKISDPDFSSGTLLQRIEGAGFAHFTMHQIAGFSLENSFRELGPGDFEGALLLAKGLENKSLRATAIIALAASCLESLERMQKQKEPPKQKR